MARLGRYFKAPPKRAARRWLKVELLYSFGERFDAGNSGLDLSCTTLATTVRYLADEGHSESEIQDRIASIRRIRASK